MDLFGEIPSTSPTEMDLADLVTQLQQEKHLVHTEKRLIQDFSEKLTQNTVEFLKAAWINCQHRINLSCLVGARAETAAYCARRAHVLTNSTFVDANKILEYQVMVNYSAFLSCLRTRPELVAQWIVIGESLIEDQRTFSGILHSVVTGLYGSLLLPQDVRLMLTLLQCLAKLQLVTTDNPRRLLKQRLCAFSRMYFLFHEGLTSAKLFLIAALQAPILQLIATSDTYLDIDPAKALSRYTASERAAKFGAEGTDAYDAQLALHRVACVQRLCATTKLFIASLQDNVHCFPGSLAWLIRQIAHMISKSFSPNAKEINAIATDLIFTLFVCPAIVQPEPYGISDAPISDVARHNLMQVGTIIQMLALIKFETPDAKLMDLYALFDASCIADFLDVILNHSERCDVLDEPIPVENVPGVCRKIALFAEHDLYELVTFLKRAQNSIMQDQAGNDEASTDYCSNNADNAAAQPNDPVVVLVNKLPTSNASPKKAKHARPQHDGGVVLVIPLDGDEEEEEDEQHQQQQLQGDIGLLPEEKVLELATAAGSMAATSEKRARFAHTDDGSVGNASDNLEAISEAASNHSVASSIELEHEDQNDNDNLSDMVSANVSGRGTPNISGRDTPSSQVTENEDHQRARVEAPPQPQLKQIRSEIDDKFCKFEIKKLLAGDETISIISDTWSTDVLVASDSETIDAAAGGGDGRQQLAQAEAALDAVETHSESAWSTDVLASSDTERLTEVDNDDAASAASAPPSEHDEHAPPDHRRLSTNSSCAPNSPGACCACDARRDSMPIADAKRSMLGVVASAPAPKADTQASNTSLSSSSSSGSSNGSGRKHQWPRAPNGDAAAVDAQAQRARQKPSPSTGAIPKSISFDMSAEKGDKEKEVDDDPRSKRPGFLGKFRINFRQRRGKSFRGGNSGGAPGGDDCAAGGGRFDDEDAKRRHSEGVNMKALQDATEDILAKYRTSKPTDANVQHAAKHEKSHADVEQLAPPSDAHAALADAQKKLRWVLSHSRAHCRRRTPPAGREARGRRRAAKTDLEAFLQIELAKARDLRQFANAARVAAALRCVRPLDAAGVDQLCDALRAAMRTRAAYRQYLFASKQTLLSSQAFLSELGEQVRRERDLCAAVLVGVCVRSFLDAHHAELAAFCVEFQRQVLIDEKNQLLEEFLRRLGALIGRDALWLDAAGHDDDDDDDAHLRMTRDALERAIMTEVYHAALYPNGDGDRHREIVLASHLRRLARTTTPGNRYLMISRVHQLECPWLPAQEALQAMAAYRTPRDKVACVTRCAFAIMDLLSLAQGASASADDLIPVLVYVIIQVNPPDLLSTIQYVNSFYGNLAGEDFFYWTQFCSAVEFTKTMEYAD